MERERLEARKTAHERRLLAEVDQARHSAKVLEAELVKKKMRRLQVEEAAVVELKTHWVALEEAMQAVRELPEELHSQAVALTHARGQEESLGEKLDAVRRQPADEAAMHAQARATLAQAIAAVAQRLPKQRGQGSVPQK